MQRIFYQSLRGNYKKGAYIYALHASGRTVQWETKKRWNTEILQRTSDATLNL
jgi:hypothetical protein